MNKIISLDSLQRLVIAPLKRLIDKKVDKSDIDAATDEDVIGLLLDMDMMPVVQDADGAILVDSDNIIILT